MRSSEGECVRGSGVECVEGFYGVSAWCGSEGGCVAWFRGGVC